MTLINKKTLNYYRENTADFVKGTINADMGFNLKKFLDRVPKQGSILDFGCGSGRDTKTFLELGYEVEAVDGSPELCKIASEYTGVPVKQMYFQELDEVERYDGIWACASILHLPYKELKPVLVKMATALKEHGVIYTSFKYGDFEGERNGRYFTDMKEEELRKLVEKTGMLSVEEMWVTADVREGRGDERWVNAMLRKSKMMTAKN